MKIPILITRPTSPFTILEPQIRWIDEFYKVWERRLTDFEAPKLWKGSSGSSPPDISLFEGLKIPSVTPVIEITLQEYICCPDENPHQAIWITAWQNILQFKDLKIPELRIILYISETTIDIFWGS